jgi:ABC-type sugar transport system permease subunit
MSRINRFPFAWILPVLVPVSVFVVFPVPYAIWTSLHQVQLLMPDENSFVGLENFRNAIHERSFLPSLVHSLVFTSMTAPVVVVLGMMIALLLRRAFLGVRIVRSFVLLPWVLPGAISAVLWMWVFHPVWGLINGLLRGVGVIRDPIPWLTDPILAFLSVSVAYVWTQIPFAVVLLMAALSAINPEMLEAATVDGATSWQRYRYVTFPQVKAMIVVLVVYNALAAFTNYDVVYAMTGGGPGQATTLLSFQIWRQSFSLYDFGAGSAVAVIVVLVSLVMITAITKALPSDLYASG